VLLWAQRISKLLSCSERKEKKINIHSDVLLKIAKEKIQTNLSQKTGHLTSLGTAFGVNIINSLGGFGTRNLADETFEYASEISGEKLKEQYYRKNTACNSCPVAMRQAM